MFTFSDSGSAGQVPDFAAVRRRIVTSQVCTAMTKRIDPVHEFARLDATLKNYANKVDSGEIVDTTALAKDIEVLCEQLAATPANGAGAFAGDLQELLSGLEGLESALREKFGELQQRLALLAPETAGDR